MFDFFMSNVYPSYIQVPSLTSENWSLATQVVFTYKFVITKITPPHLPIDRKSKCGYATNLLNIAWHNQLQKVRLYQEFLTIQKVEVTDIITLLKIIGLLITSFETNYPVYVFLCQFLDNVYVLFKKIT